MNLHTTTSRDQIIEKLRTFKNENAEKYGIESMALFGSVARGEHNENSDVDGWFVSALRLKKLANTDHQKYNIIDFIFA